MTLQKEQGLLSSAKPSAGALKWAMGGGVPDASSPNTAYEGFGKQVWFGAKSLHNDGLSWYAGISKVCGDGTVQPADQASDALYTYTPWIGVNGGGNKLFWTIYWEYFGDPLAVDAVAPTTSVTGNDASWHDKAVTLTLSAVDNPGGTGVAYTQYTIAAGPWTKGSSVTVPASTNHTDDGSQIIHYRSVDDAGNTEKAQSRTVKIDTTPPTVTDDAPSGSQNTAVTVTLSPVDDGSGVCKTQYRPAGSSAWLAATSDQFVVAAPADHSNDGAHNYQYRAIDNAGNVSDIGTCTVRIGTAKPTVTIFTPTSGPVGCTVTLSGSGFSDATAVSFDGNATTFSVESDTLIIANVPAGFSTGNIVVATPGGEATSAEPFTLMVTTPELTLGLGGLTGGALKLGDSVTASGTVEPADLNVSKITLAVQRKKSGEWVKTRNSVCEIDSTGAYSWQYKPAKKGAYRLRAMVAKTATYAAAKTKWLKFKVR